MNTEYSANLGNQTARKTPWAKRINLIILGLVLAVGVKTAVEFFVQGPIPPSNYPDIGGEFILNSANGPVTHKILIGKVSVLFFGYTNCPDICPTTLSNIGAAFRKLREASDLKSTQGFFITIDPARDDVEHVTNYVKYFNSSIIGLSGSETQIAAVANSFKVGYTMTVPVSKLSNNITHSGYIYVIRPDGQVGDILSRTSTPKNIVEAVRKWLPWVNA